MCIGSDTASESDAGGGLDVRRQRLQAIGKTDEVTGVFVMQVFVGVGMLAPCKSVDDLFSKDGGGPELVIFS